MNARERFKEWGMGLSVFGSEESKAVQQQMKELGWI
jgi:hypothetical protein